MKRLSLGGRALSVVVSAAMVVSLNVPFAYATDGEDAVGGVPN